MLFGMNSKKKVSTQVCPDLLLYTLPHLPFQNYAHVQYNTSSFCCLSLTALSFNNLSSFNFLLLSDCCFLMYFCKTRPKVPIRLNFIGSNNINNSFHGCGLQHLSFPRPLQSKRFVKMAAMPFMSHQFDQVAHN